MIGVRVETALCDFQVRFVGYGIKGVATAAKALAGVAVTVQRMLV